MGVRASFSSGLFWENVWYGAVLVVEGKMLSVFDFDFFGVLPLRFFCFFFVVLLFSGSIF